MVFRRPSRSWTGGPCISLYSALSIVLIDLLLAGDNALVIALAVRSLEGRARRLGCACGAGAAVVLRVALTAAAARILTISYLQLAGGILVIWIAVKVLRDASDPPDAAPAPKRFWQAIWYIALADLTMSTDNILAIAGVFERQPLPDSLRAGPEHSIHRAFEQPSGENHGSLPGHHVPGRGHPGRSGEHVLGRIRPRWHCSIRLTPCGSGWKPCWSWG